MRLKSDGIILQEHYVPDYEALKRSISHGVAFMDTRSDYERVTHFIVKMFVFLLCVIML